MRHEAGWTYEPIHVNIRRKIIALDFPNQQLTDSAIRDFSRLPPTLKRLNLGLCRLTNRFDISKLPASIRELDLSNNYLTELDFSALPRGLETFYVGFNYLTVINLTGAPEGLRTLVLLSNDLVAIHGAMPPNLKLLVLHQNRLRDDTFRRLREEKSDIEIEGEGDQVP